MFSCRNAKKNGIAKVKIESDKSGMMRKMLAKCQFLLLDVSLKTTMMILTFLVLLKVFIVYLAGILYLAGTRPAITKAKYERK